MRTIFRKAKTFAKCLHKDPLDLFEYISFYSHPKVRQGHILERPIRKQTIQDIKISSNSCIILGSGENALDPQRPRDPPTQEVPAHGFVTGERDAAESVRSDPRR